MLILVGYSFVLIRTQSSNLGLFPFLFLKSQVTIIAYSKGEIISNNHRKPTFNSVANWLVCDSWSTQRCFIRSPMSGARSVCELRIKRQFGFLLLCNSLLSCVAILPGYDARLLQRVGRFYLTHCKKRIYIYIFRPSAPAKGPPSILFPLES